jgi:hypothetical protein
VTVDDACLGLKILRFIGLSFGSVDAHRDVTPGIGSSKLVAVLGWLGRFKMRLSLV